MKEKQMKPLLLIVSVLMFLSISLGNGILVKAAITAKSSKSKPIGSDTQNTSGRVVGPDGKALSGSGVVYINQPGQSWGTSLIFQNGGVFNLSTLKAGTYILRAEQPNSNFAYSKDYTIVIGRDSSGKKIVTDGRGVQYRAGKPLILKLVKSIVKGSVLDSKGKPTSADYIQVMRKSNVPNVPDKWLPFVSVYKGNFRLGFELEGSYILKAIANQDAQETFSIEKIVTVKAIDGVMSVYMDGKLVGSENPLVLSTAKTQLIGKVQIPEGSDVSVPDGYLSAYRYLTNGSIESESDVQIIKGAFKLGGLAPGEYMLRANPNTNSSFTFSEDVRIKIKEVNGESVASDLSDKVFDETNPIVISYALIQFTAQVFEPDDKTPAKAHIIVNRKDTGMLVGTYGVDQTGKVSIGRLKNGEYRIKADSNDNKYLPSKEVLVTVNEKERTINGVATTDGNIKLYLHVPAFSGIVKIPAGISAAVPNGWISIAKLMEDGSAKYLSDCYIRDGKFQLDKMDQGKYEFVAEPEPLPGDVYYRSKPVIIYVNQVNGRTEITDSNGIKLNETNPLVLMYQTPQFMGHIYAPDGSITKAAKIRIRETRTDKTKEVYLDQNGVFKIAELPDGIYGIKAFPNNNDLMEASREIIVELNGKEKKVEGVASDKIELTIALTKPQIVGGVSMPTGAIGKLPDGLLNVKLLKPDGSVQVMETRRIENGKFNLGDLESGTYTLETMPSEQYEHNLVNADVVTIHVTRNGADTEIKSSQGQSYNKNNPLVIPYNIAQLDGHVYLQDKTTYVQSQSAVIYAYDNTTGQLVNSVFAELNGRFKLGGLKDGTYKIQAMQLGSNYNPSNEVIVVISNHVLTVDGKPLINGTELKLYLQNSI